MVLLAELAEDGSAVTADDLGESGEVELMGGAVLTAFRGPDRGRAHCDVLQRGDDVQESPGGDRGLND